MSKLAAQLKVAGQREVRHLMRHVKVEADWKPSATANMALAKRYLIAATFSAQVHLTEHDESRGRVVGAVADAKRQITREVFGEFVPLLCEAKYALYNYDHETALKLIDRVLAGFDSDEEVSGMREAG